jgi:hypothetical protein
MRLLFLIGFMVCCGASLAADQQDCGAAVDDAESLNVNQTNNCDYSQEGLNGFMQKAFNKSAQQDASTAPDTATSIGASNLQVEVDQWAAIPLARNQLLPQALMQCPKGFRVVGEDYRPLGMGRIELSLNIKCIN